MKDEVTTESYGKRITALADKVGEGSWNATMDTPQEHPLFINKDVFEKNMPEGLTPELFGKAKSYERDFREAFILASGKRFLRDPDVANAAWREVCPMESFEARVTDSETLRVEMSLSADLKNLNVAVSEVMKITSLNTFNPVTMLQIAFKDRLKELAAG